MRRCTCGSSSVVAIPPRSISPTGSATATQARADPDLTLRLYRDAQLAEAIYCDARSRYASLAGVPDIDDAVLDSQWPRNLLLNKWLAYCLAQGHSFGGANRPRVASED